MQKIAPFLWFNNNAEEASVAASGQRKGSPMTTSFQLNGQEFIALNGGPAFKFTEAFSFVANCESQEEVDYFWNRLISDGGQESMCGWLKDKFGLSWQIVPTVLGKYLNDKDSKKSQRTMQAMLQMKKIIIADLEKVYNGE